MPRILTPKPTVRKREVMTLQTDRSVRVHRAQDQRAAGFKPTDIIEKQDAGTARRAYLHPVICSGLRRAYSTTSVPGETISGADSWRCSCC